MPQKNFLPTDRLIIHVRKQHRTFEQSQKKVCVWCARERNGEWTERISVVQSVSIHALTFHSRLTEYQIEYSDGKKKNEKKRTIRAFSLRFSDCILRRLGWNVPNIPSNHFATISAEHCPIVYEFRCAALVLFRVLFCFVLSSVHKRLHQTVR